jgi:hypothetical protein
MFHLPRHGAQRNDQCTNTPIMNQMLYVKLARLKMCVEIRTNIENRIAYEFHEVFNTAVFEVFETFLQCNEPIEAM